MIDKKILHFKIQSDLNGIPIYSPELLGKFMKLIQDKLKDEYIIIASPYDPSTSYGDSFCNFDMQQLTKEDLLNMIKN